MGNTQAELFKTMTKQEIEETYFVEFIKWCADPQSEKPGDLLFWIDYKFPSLDNFWEWIVKYKKDSLV